MSAYYVRTNQGPLCIARHDDRDEATARFDEWAKDDKRPILLQHVTPSIPLYRVIKQEASTSERNG